MPVPVPIPQMDIPTNSNIAFAGKIANGKMTFEIALPKQHLMEMMGMFQMMQKQQQMQQMQKKETTTSAQNLRLIGLACLMYAKDYDDKFPPNLQVLVEKYDLSPENLKSSLKPEGFDGPSYIYVEGQNTKMEPGNVLVYENPAFCSDKINVLFLDAHVVIIKPAEFLQELQATYKRLGREMPEVKFKVSPEAIKK
jgi:prepilin-type processing-associated H-X9-DG protein